MAQANAPATPRNQIDDLDDMMVSGNDQELGADDPEGQQLADEQHNPAQNLAAGPLLEVLQGDVHQALNDYLLPKAQAIEQVGPGRTSPCQLDLLVAWAETVARTVWQALSSRPRGSLELQAARSLRPPQEIAALQYEVEATFSKADHEQAQIQAELHRMTQVVKHFTQNISSLLMVMQQ